MIIIQIILRIIYYPIGWLGDLFDFIAGALHDIDGGIKMKIVFSKQDKYNIKNDNVKPVHPQNVYLPKRLTTMSDFESVCNHYLQNHYKMNGEFIDGFWYLSIKITPHQEVIGNSHDLYSTDKNKRLNIRFESMKKYIEEHKIIGVFVKYV